MDFIDFNREPREIHERFYFRLFGVFRGFMTSWTFMNFHFIKPALHDSTPRLDSVHGF